MDCEIALEPIEFRTTTHHRRAPGIPGPRIPDTFAFTTNDGDQFAEVIKSLLHNKLDFCEQLNRKRLNRYDSPARMRS